MESLLNIGLSNAFAALVLAALAFVMDRTLRRPAVSHLFWLLVLVKLVTPPLVRLPLPWPSNWSPQSAAVPASMQKLEMQAMSSSPDPDSAAMAGTDVPAMAAESGVEAAALPAPISWSA